MPYPVEFGFIEKAAIVIALICAAWLAWFVGSLWSD